MCSSMNSSEMNERPPAALTTNAFYGTPLFEFVLKAHRLFDDLLPRKALGLHIRYLPIAQVTVKDAPAIILVS
jgi:hypothetical protein